MTKTARYLALAAALLLATAYALPLWRVGLVAPQYPEGLGMRIHINNVVGMKEYDLGSINGLNHYIGMKTIEPDAIPELKIMPYILGALVMLGLITAATGKRAVLLPWATGLGRFFVAGLRTCNHQDPRHDVPAAAYRFKKAAQLHRDLMARFGCLRDGHRGDHYHLDHLALLLTPPGGALVCVCAFRLSRPSVSRLRSLAHRRGRGRSSRAKTGARIVG
jgi:hypothetical protein